MEMKDCLLTPNELRELQDYVEPVNESIGYERNIAKAQLEKCKAWAEEQVKAERERILDLVPEEVENEWEMLALCRAIKEGASK